MYQIGAYITAYQDRNALEQCLTALKNQTYPIEKILIIDNSPDLLFPLDLKEERIIIQFHPENIGISGGLKIAISWAIDNKFDFLWTFDQDSQPSTDTLEKLIICYNSLLPKIAQIGIIAPLPVDYVTGQKWQGIIFDRYQFRENDSSNENIDYYECDAVITSGSLVSIEAAIKVPPPEINFFIDAVDWDYCMKFRQYDYKVIVDKKNILNHRFGNSSQIDLSLLNKKITIYNYSPLRYYYRCRNHTFVETRLAIMNRHLKQSILKRLQGLFILVIKILFFEKNLVFLKTWACLKGTYDGFLGKLGKTWL